MRRGRPRDTAVDEKILKATLAELAECGYQGMSVDGIAARAGVSKPTIYRRWPNKPALAMGALTELVSRESPDLTGDSLTDLVGQLKAVHENLIRAGSVTLLGTLWAESERHPGFIEAYRTLLLQPRRGKLRMILVAARDRGHIIAGDDDLDDATLFLLSLLFGKYMAGEPTEGDWLVPGVRFVLRSLGYKEQKSVRSKAPQGSKSQQAASSRKANRKRS